MRERRAHIPAVLLASMVLALLASPAANALASSGEITRSQANAGWTAGSIAGSAIWGGCKSLPCRWLPYVTVGQGTDPSECSADDRRWPHSDEQVTLAWSGGERSAGGSATFDVPEVPLSGVPGQLACLSLLEIYEERPECVLEPGVVCPMYIIDVVNYSVLASAPLSAPPPSPPVNTELPQLTGTPKVGETLTCSNGAWTGSPTSFGRIWLRDGGQIAGETGTTYVVKSADQGHSIACEVTATSEVGSSSATSNALAVPPPPPPPPTIGNESATNVTEHNATLGADINPNGLLTKYKLQIDTTGHFKFDQNDSCVLHPPGIFCAQVVIAGEPLPPGLVEPPESTLPASLESQHVSVNLAIIGATLQPNTTYHYRAIAASGLPVVEGPDQTFTTPSAGEPPAIEDESETTETTSTNDPANDGGSQGAAIVNPTPSSVAPSSRRGRHGPKKTDGCNRKLRHQRHGQHLRWHRRGSRRACASIASAQVSSR
jgi:hypothetical protein